MFLETSQNSEENTCARVSFLIKLQACNFIKKETQVFSCDFCKTPKNNFSYRTPLVAASLNRKLLQYLLELIPKIWSLGYPINIKISLLEIDVFLSKAVPIVILSACFVKKLTQSFEIQFFLISKPRVNFS